MAVDYFANPPPGLDLSESRTSTNNAIGIVLFILSLVFVLLRLFTRLRLKHESLGLDDYLMCLGLALNAGNLACCIAGGFFGLGKHIWSLGPYEMRKITIITFAYVFIYAWSVCIIKFSILALYRRIFGLSWLGWFCIVLTSGYLLTNHIVLPLYTRPLHYYWNQWYGAEGKILVDEAKFYLGVGIINLFGDICILMVPISSVLKLHMERTQKIAICFMFLLGSFVCFASLYRIITITHLVQSRDISWAKSDVFIWSSVEPSIGIISGCLPTLRPLLVRVLDTCSSHIPSTRKSSVKNDSQPYPLNPIDTISKKRTRKITKNDDLERTLVDGTDTKVGARGERKSWVKAKHNHEHSKSWRPDEDEMCLTTTTVHGSDKGDSQVVIEDLFAGRSDAGGITMTKEFDWDEAKRD
ncbi:Nn.00g103850.m01.CDS01 [Neocucurbitaria sp. VM-36]